MILLTIDFIYRSVLRESMASKKENRKLHSASTDPLSKQANASEFPRDFLGIFLPEQPNKYYFVLRGQRLVLEADSTIQTIMEKLQSYKTRVALNFEGFQYQLGDFQLRVGKVVSIQSESLRGIVMEMEYRPISSWEKSHKIMGEFFDIWQEALSKRSLAGHFVHMEPNFGGTCFDGKLSPFAFTMKLDIVTKNLVFRSCP
ncbi:hypothetical protein LXL04_008190 [Taraxacum kok-saghyz]